jgi:hypothetical protein
VTSRRLKATRFICNRDGFIGLRRVQTSQWFFSRTVPWMKDFSLCRSAVQKLKLHSMSGSARRWLQIGTAALTGIIALSAYAGVVGLIGGAISFDETINARLPFQSLFLAGIALLLVVAAPMTAAAVACIRDLRVASELVIGAGLLLTAWIAVELAFIKSYSWFHPTYLGLAILVLISGWLLERASRANSESTANRQAEPQLRP